MTFELASAGITINKKSALAQEGRFMTALLGLEPRDAGASVIEPDIEFDSELDPLRTRTMCHGCCRDSSHVIETTGTVAH